jgi:hypothetical protein
VFHDDDGTSTVWVKMDVPPSRTDPKTYQKTLYDEPSPSQVDTFRTLDESVVKYLCEEYEVVVKHVNYEHVRCLEYSPFHVTAYGERLYGMVDELMRELAVVEAERGRLLVSDACYETLFSAGRMVTTSVEDILPLATLLVDGLVGASSTTSVYNSSSPPGTVPAASSFSGKLYEQMSQYRWCRGSSGKRVFFFTAVSCV